MHKKSSSQLLLLKLPKTQAGTNKFSKTALLMKTYIPNPPLSHTAKLIAESNLDAALISLVECVKVKQENSNMVFSHLYLFMMNDEELDPALRNMEPAVALTEEALQLH